MRSPSMETTSLASVKDMRPSRQGPPCTTDRPRPGQSRQLSRPAGRRSQEGWKTSSAPSDKCSAVISVFACLVLNAGALFVAVRFALAAGSGVRCSRLVLTTLSGYVVVIHTAVLLAGLLGSLTIKGLAVS